MVSVFLTGVVDFAVGLPGVIFAGRIGWRGSTMTVVGAGAGFGVFAAGSRDDGGCTFGSPTGPVGGGVGLAEITGIVPAGSVFVVSGEPVGFPATAVGFAGPGFVPVVSVGFVAVGLAGFGAGFAFGSAGPAGFAATS